MDEVKTVVSYKNNINFKIKLNLIFLFFFLTKKTLKFFKDYNGI
jgi:hypothetical protein